MSFRPRHRAKPFVSFVCLVVPEANGQGKTREVCLESLAAAIELVLDYRREQGREKAPRGAEQTPVLV
jgi:predicted RNase H-like HicB family nuclease